MYQIHDKKQMQSKTVITSGPGFGFLLPFSLSFLVNFHIFLLFSLFSLFLIKLTVKKKHFLSVALEKDLVSMELDWEHSSSHLWLHKGRKYFLVVVFLNCFTLVVN